MVNRSVVRMEKEEQYQHSAAHETFHLIILLGVFAIVLLAQVAMVEWKKRSPKSFHRVTLAGLLIFPIWFSIYFRWLLLPFGILLFSAGTAYIAFYLKSPHATFWWFLFIHKTSNAIVWLGWFLFILNYLGLPYLVGYFYPDGLTFNEAIHMYELNLDIYVIEFILLLPFNLFIYGIYYGILGRDFAQLATDTIALRMGIGLSKAQLRDRNQDTLAPSTDICGICADRFDGRRIEQLEEGEGAERAPSLEEVLGLSCGHGFHGICLRGWVIVGKRDTCPVCAEKVNLDELKQPWQKQTLFYAAILDAVRYLIVWNPILSFLIHHLVNLIDYHEA